MRNRTKGILIEWTTNWEIEDKRNPEIEEGKMIDVINFMSKWVTAIVTKVGSNKFEVMVEGGLQMEIQ